MNKFAELLEKKKYFSLKPFDINTEDGRAAERYRKMFLTSFASIGSKSIGLAINLIMVPLTYDYLGEERFGLWMTLSSLIMILSFTDLGLGNNLLNEVAYARGKEDKQIMRIAVTNTIIPLIFVSIFLLTLALIGTKQINWSNFFKLNEQLSKSEINISLLIFIVIFVIGLPIRIINQINEGFQEGYINNFWQSIGNIFGLINIFICIKLKLGLPFLIIAYSGTQLIATIINFFTQIIRKPVIRPSYKYYNINKIKSELKSGLIFFLLGIFTLLGLQTDNIIISNQLGAEYVANYAILQKLIMVIFVVMVFIQSLWPAYAEAISRNDIKWVQITIRRMFKYSLGLGGIFSVLFYFLGPFIIRTWIGHDLQISNLLLIGFACYALVWLFIGNVAVILNSGKFLKFQLIILIIATILALAVKIIFVKILGLSLIIWATNISFFLFFIIPALIFIRFKYFKEKL